MLAAVGLYFKSNHRQGISFSLFPSPKCKTFSTALKTQLSSTAQQPAPCYWFSLKAATHPRKPKQWHHWKTKVREGTAGAGEVLHTIMLAL